MRVNRFVYIHIGDAKSAFLKSLFATKRDWTNKYTTKLAILNEATENILNQFSPHHIAIESVFFSVNAGTAIKLGQARGAAICACSRKGIEIFEYSPRKVKNMVTLNGAADKDQLQKEVKKKLNIRRKLEIDASDALGVAICHALMLTENQDIPSV